MRRKKGLLAVVIALAVSSAMAAMAYTYATVSTPGEIKISTTDKALLAFSVNSGIGTNDNTAYVDPTDSLLKFRPGWSQQTGTWAGLQRGSSYQYNNIIKVTNNSKDWVQLRVDNGVTGAPAGTHWSIFHGSNSGYSGGKDGALVLDNIGFYGTRLYDNGLKRYEILAPGASIDLTISVSVDSYTQKVTVDDLKKVGIEFNAVAVEENSK